MRGYEVRERGRREGREREREEVGEGGLRCGGFGVRRVVREVGFQAAGEGEGA